MPRDIGKFVGRYLQVLACLSVATMVLTVVFRGTLKGDFLVILEFLLAAYLIEHRPAARKWAIGLFAVVVAGSLAALTVAAIAGTDAMNMYVFGLPIDHPTVGAVAALACAAAVFGGLPLALLLSPQARREFQRPDDMPRREGTQSP